MKSEDSAIDHIKRAIKYLERVAGEAEDKEGPNARRSERRNGDLLRETTAEEGAISEQHGPTS